jgi:16S rRNA (guanine1207-N2)-methyltransferase
MDHYFSENQRTDHELMEVTTYIRGIEFTFLTDKGVFSRKKIDKGSKLLAESVEIKETDTILDMGCGYGIIGLVLSKFARTVHMIDINKRAVHLARKNMAINECFNVVITRQDFFEVEERFDLVVTNPPFRMGKKFVFKMIERAPALLADCGRFCMVVRTKQGAKSYEEKITEIFGACRIVSRGSGYRVFEGTQCAD